MATKQAGIIKLTGITTQKGITKGAGFTKEEEDQMVDGNDRDDNCMELEDSEMEDKCMEPDAKVPKLEDCESFDDFQRVDDKHTPSSIPANETKKYPTKRCVDCKKRGIRRESRYYCNDCSDYPALCKACFNGYHL